MQERAFRVHGRVQGVGFRWWTREQAQRLEVTGTVRNEGDGTVEVRVRGPSRAVSALADLLHVGPPGAAVSRVDEADASEVPSDGFRILR